MENEIKSMNGEIKNIKRDGKAINVCGEWFNAFQTSTLSKFNKGDIVGITYVQKNNFNNIKTITLLESNNSTLEPKPLDQVLTPSNLPKGLDSSNKNTIIMCSKDIIIKIIKDHGSMSELEFNKTFDNIVNQLIKAYNKL